MHMPDDIASEIEIILVEPSRPDIVITLFPMTMLDQVNGELRLNEVIVLTSDDRKFINRLAWKMLRRLTTSRKPTD